MALPTIAFAQADQEVREEWRYPWPKGYVAMTWEIEKENIDGYDAKKQLWSGPGITIGLELTARWLFKESEDASFRLSPRGYRDVDCQFYVYPTKAFPVSNQPDRFRAYLEGVARSADKEAQLRFVKNADGAIRIEPERIVNKGSIFYNPNAQEPQGELPRIMGQFYYDVRYSCVREEQAREGTLVFVYLSDFVLCMQLEANPEDIARCRQTVMEMLESAYRVSSGSQG